MSDSPDGAHVRPIRSDFDQKVIELKKEHEDVLEFEAAGVRIAVRPPKPTEFERFVSTVSDDKKLVSGCRGLLRSCLLYPAWDELYEGPLTRRPGLITALGQELAKEAGVGIEVEVKKA